MITPASNPRFTSTARATPQRHPPAGWRRATAVALVAGLALALAVAPAWAQRVTGEIQGKISRSGAAQAQAAITATNVDNGAQVTTRSGADGSYVLTGLAPGQYLVTVAADGQEAVEYVDVGIGQTLQIAIDVATATTQGAERIEVSARRFESRTSEVATDIDQTQLSNLPQNSRNFLNFAELAPGVRLSTEELAKNVSSAGLAARQTNVFVDGLSLKNNIIEGGVVGQDASRGNPFPQLAIAGFRVLTQNYKAEYEQAGSAIISTVTRSGGNELHGEFYGSYQDRNVTAIDPFVEKLMLDKPEYRRFQVGGLLSGPIIKDRLFALATYEGNYQDRANNVTIGNASPENAMRFGSYEGSFTSPFREHLAFGKLTWLPRPDHTADLSVSLRRETDIRSFGGVTSFESAENVRNNVVTAQLRHQWRAPSGHVNEANVQFLDSQFNPSIENPDLVGQDFQGTIRIGGRDTEQDIVQRTIVLRDDVTFPTVTAAGSHQFKAGARLAFQRYDVESRQFGNPVFRYRVDEANDLDYDIPFEAEFGVGNPLTRAYNKQIGLYAQDDWQIDRLTLNLGVRWDIETNPLNNDFVTPDAVRTAVTELAQVVAERNGPEFFRVDNYVTDGNQRPIYFGAIQPRLGASYDVFGDLSTVVFGGAGRYYDRTLFNTGVNERSRLRYEVRRFRFSRDGMPREGLPTLVWDPAYLSRDGLQGLIDSGIAPAPEIFLVENDTKPLHTDQLSAGVRQVLGPFNLTFTFSHIRGENGVGFYPANRERTGNRDFIPVTGFGNVLISADDIQSRFTGFYLTAEKPYSEASKWGVTASYTLGWSKIRGDSFNFDFPSIADTPLTPANDDERHRLVVGAIAGLPYDFKISTLITLGSGLPYNVIDASQGFGADQVVFRRNGGRQDGTVPFKQVDLRLAKELEVARGQRAVAFVEVFNLFNWYNYGDFDGFLPPTTGDPNPTFGEPKKIITTPLSLQLGLNYAF